MRSVGTVAESLKQQLLTDFRQADISDMDKLMLSYVEKITRTPQSISERDIEELRLAGFDDRAIHDIVQVAAYFNYVNRLADGLGVEME